MSLTTSPTKLSFPSTSSSTSNFLAGRNLNKALPNSILYASGDETPLSAQTSQSSSSSSWFHDQGEDDKQKVYEQNLSQGSEREEFPNHFQSTSIRPNEPLLHEARSAQVIAAPPPAPLLFEDSLVVDKEEVRNIYKFIKKYKPAEEENFPVFFPNHGSKPLQGVKLTVNDFTELMSIEKLAHQYNKDTISLLIKEYRVQILSKIEARLISKLTKLTNNNPTEEIKTSPLITCLKKTSYYVVGFFGTILAGIGGFLGVYGILTGFFTGMSSLIAMPISAGLSFVECLVFFFFDLGSLKIAMGFDNRQMIEKCLDTDKEEMNLIRSTHDLMRRLQNQANELEICEYNRVSKEYNKIMSVKKEYYAAELKESKIKKTMKYLVTFFNGVLAITATYYVASSFAAICLLTGPAGWAIIGVSVFTASVIFIIMRRKNIASKFFPETEKFKKIKLSIGHFKMYETEFVNTHKLSEKLKRVEKELSRKNNTINLLAPVNRPLFLSRSFSFS